MDEPKGKRYMVAHIDQIESLPEKGTAAEWKPVRHHFGVGSFGVNLFRAPAGEFLTYLHDETDTGHEELFFVAGGRARFSVDGEEFEAPAGTFVYVADPAATRGAWAEEDGSVLFVAGGKPGIAFTVQDWEREEFEELGIDG
jgi:quercetin dioxygenase-like cupin family protein